MKALRSILIWPTTRWRSRSAWGMAWDPTYVTRWKHKVGFNNREIQWDTPMARWAGERNDWIKLMAQQQLRKKDVIHSLLTSLRQTVEKKIKANETRPAKKTKELHVNGGARSRPATTNCRLGEHISFASTTKNLICGLQKA